MAETVVRPQARPQLARVSTVQAIADSLVERILDGEFRPGTPLREVELASTYVVGRNSIRAALQQLAHMGLVRHLPNRGVFVPELSLHDVTDIYRLRTAIEVEAVGELARRGSAGPLVDAAMEELRREPADAKWSSLVEADLRIHRALVASVDSPHLERAYGEIRMEVRLCLTQLQTAYEAPHELLQKHQAILNAVHTGREDDAEAAVRLHIRLGAAQLFRQSDGNTESDETSD